MYDGFSFEQMSEAFKRLHEQQDVLRRQDVRIEDLEYEIRQKDDLLASMAAKLEAGRVTPEEQEARLTNLRRVKASSDKIGMIKAVRTMTGLGLKEAKDLVEAMM